MLYFSVKHFNNNLRTRKHSNMMRTVRCSGCLMRGCLPGVSAEGMSVQWCACLNRGGLPRG